MIDLEYYHNQKQEISGRNITLVAVSKNQAISQIQLLYDQGHRNFGENKAQELSAKYQELPADIKWHFIGHLQTNKIKYIIPFVSLIHSVDSFKLLIEINKEAKKLNRIIDCLMQIYIASEETKYGLDEVELFEILNSEQFNELNNINICGLMGMATFTDDQNIVRQEFRYLKKLFEKVRSVYFVDSKSFKELSMGMSDDYKIAIEEGSTMLRIGTSIFGKRVYQ